MEGSSSHRSPEKDSREKLIASAISVFARKGYDGATVKELADEAGLNISAVSYYFGGKEGLYRACFEQVGRERVQTVERILQKPQSREEFRVRFKLWAHETLTFMAEHRDVCTMIDRECDSQMKVTHDIFLSTFLKTFTTLETFFRQAQEAGVVRAEINVTLMSGLVFSAIKGSVRYDSIAKDYCGVTIMDPEYREQVSTAMVEYLIVGFLTER